MNISWVPQIQHFLNVISKDCSLKCLCISWHILNLTTGVIVCVGRCNMSKGITHYFQDLIENPTFDVAKLSPDIFTIHYCGHRE